MAGLRELLGVRGEQDQCGQARRTDGVSLGHGLGRVADRIERVRDLTDFLGQLGHLRDAAGVVRDRTIGVDRDDDPGHGKHRGRRDRDAVQTTEAIAQKNAGGDHHDRQRSSHHADGLARDDVGRMARDRGLRDQVHRPVRGLGEELCDGDDQHRDDDADQCREEEAVGIADGRVGREETVALHVLRDEVEADDGDDHRDQQPGVERAHDPSRIEDADKEGAGDRPDHAHGAEKQRIDHPADLVLEQ